MDTTTEVVPWVAAWSAELKPGRIRPVLDHQGRVDIEASPGIASLQGRPWICPDLQGRGRPVFAQMSMWRQARCMVDRLCQVCGGDLPDGVGIFLLSGPTLRDFLDDQHTYVPPVCPDCEPIARGACPHLAHNDQMRVVGEFEPVSWLATSTADRSANARYLILPWSTSSRRYIGRDVVVRVDV